MRCLFYVKKQGGCHLNIAVLGALIGVISALFGMFITYLTFMRNRDKDVRSDTTEQTRVSVKLDHIGKGVEDIKLELKDSDRQIGKLSEKVARIDEGVKSAHKRINKLEGKQ